MNTFTIISGLFLFALAFLCFLIPFRNGQKKTGVIVGPALGAIITWTVLGHLEFLVIFIWLLVFAFQIVFLSYWGFRAFGRRKTGRVVATVLTAGILILLLQPWISDWTFSKRDARKILAVHALELKDDFKLLENESGGFRDYYESFTLKLSDNDFNRIAQMIRTSKNYKGYFKDYSNLPSAEHNKLDTVDFETENYLEREYFTAKKMENGTYHFMFQLDKHRKELSYTGSDE